MRKKAAMNTLKDSIKMFREQIAHLLHPDAPGGGSDAGEQTEQEQHVDAVLNPWLGVDVVKHPEGRHPRRA
jgi:hypothetical protein